MYLPKGEWFDYWTGQRHSGGTRIRIPVTLASLPIYVRAGAILFLQPVVQHTGEMPGQPLRLRIFPGGATDGTFYEDDGETLEYTRGASVVRQVTYEAGDRVHAVHIGAPSGSYRPAPRSLEISVPWEGEPRRVFVGADQTLARVPFDGLDSHSSGWTMHKGSVIVRQPDSFGALRITIER